MTHPRRPTDIRQIARFQKPAFALRRAQNARLQAIIITAHLTTKRFEFIGERLERKHLRRLQAVVLVEGREERKRGADCADV